MLPLFASAADKGGYGSIWRVGIKGGIELTSMAGFNYGKIDKPEDVNTATGFNAGVAFSVHLAKGLTLQPELMYIRKSVRPVYNGKSSFISFDYMELPVNLQWGLDLILIRPFIMVSPYIGYAVRTEGVNELTKRFLRSFEWGIGVGGGVDLWRFQLQARYCWNLGSIIDTEQVSEGVGYDRLFTGNFRGVEVSICFFF
ncbi:MAG: PorT family protein [Bacteroidales bacterium]|nr:PorT family protein [Bacteroidales bacterium]